MKKMDKDEIFVLGRKGGFSLETHPDDYPVPIGIELLRGEREKQSKKAKKQKA
jgi:hypothetical protein